MNGVDPSGRALLATFSFKKFVEAILHTIASVKAWAVWQLIRAQLFAAALATKYAAGIYTVTKVAFWTFIGSGLYNMAASDGLVPEFPLLRVVTMVSGVVFLLGFIVSGMVAPEHLKGQVQHGGNRLARAVQRARQASGDRGGNYAAYGYKGADGRLRIIVRRNLPRGPGRAGLHAEKVVSRDLEAIGVKKESVKYIYSELQPCSWNFSQCAKFIREQYPNASVSWSYLTSGELNKALEALFGGRGG